MADDGGVWVKVYPDAAEPGLPGLGGWADVTAVTGASGNRYTYTDIDGFDWVAYEFTDDGTLTTSGGLVEMLIASSGSSSGATYSHGGGVIAGVLEMGSDPATVTVGAQVSNYTNGNYSGVEQSTVHTRVGGSSQDVRNPNANGYVGYYDNTTQSNSRGGGAAGDAAVNTPGPGIVSSIRDGNPVEYGRGGAPGAVPANTGQGNGALNGPSGAGVVIVRVPAANALATIPGTWGDL